MSTISSGGSAAMTSPRDRLQQMLDNAVSAGSVSKTDETALSSALDDIDSQMQAGKPSAGGASGGTRTSMKDKVDGLIDSEVSSGKLTDDQATELKKMFAEAHKAMGHHGGPPPPPPASSTDDSEERLIDQIDAASSTSSTTSGTSSSSSSSSGSDPLASLDAAITKLSDFIKKLEAARAENSVYDSSGSSATTQVTQSLMVDATA